MKRRLLSVITVLALCLTLLPAASAAEAVTVGDFAVTGGAQDVDFEYADGVLTVKTETPLTISMAADVTQTTTDRVEVADGVNANVTLNGVNIDLSGGNKAAFGIPYNSTGNVTVTLKGENALKSGSFNCGLQASSTGGSLTIDGDGSLTAVGGVNAAGIGAYRVVESGTCSIIINSGTITATGDYSAAGIGGSETNRVDITINGGTVTATGGPEAAGIGGGYYDSVTGIANVTITGGTVTARGGLSDGEEGRYGGPGIGGYDSASKVIISGGTVTAIGGYYAMKYRRDPGISGHFSTGDSGAAVIYANYNTTESGAGFSDSGNWNEWKGLIFDHNTIYAGGDVTLPDSLTVSEAQTLAVLKGSALTVPDGKALTNHGVLIVGGADSITGAIEGAGSYYFCPLTPEGISAPTDLEYDGTDKTDYIKEHTSIDLTGPQSVTISGQTFTRNDESWVQTVQRVSDILYTVSYTFSGVTIGKEVPVAKTDHLVVEGGTKGEDYTYEGLVLTVLTGTPLTIKNSPDRPGLTSVDRIVVAGGVNADVTLAGVNIDVSGTEDAAAFEIAEDSKSNVALTLVGENTLKSGANCAGLQKNSSKTYKSTGTLTIAGEGSLDVTGGYRGAGIGGGAQKSSDGIVIAGGAITATGGDFAAGIGGSSSGSGYVTINAGTVKVTGGKSAPGIGSGGSGRSEVTINGGNVEAVSGYGGPGIGGESATKVTITGGTVKATGSLYAAGIGGGARGTGSVTISGGAVTAIGGVYEADPTTNGPGIGDGGLYQSTYPGSFSTGENGSAQIVAIGGISDKRKQGEWKGLIFDGDAGFVGGLVPLSADLTVEAGQTLTVATGAKLTIPAGLTLTNNGTIIVSQADSITCQGTLTGDGTYKSCCLTEDMIAVPDLIYEGEPLTEALKAQTTIVDSDPIVISGKTFAFDPTLWTMDVTQQDKTEYTVTYSYSGMTVSKQVTTRKYQELQVEGGTEGTDYTYEDGLLTVKTATPLTLRNQPLAQTTTDHILIAGGVNADVTLAGVNIDVSSNNGVAAFEIATDSDASVTVRLAEDTTNTLKSGANCAGLQKNSTPVKDESSSSYLPQGAGTLTIEGPGALTAQGGLNGAGIGGGSQASGCNIIINGGHITASGRFWGANIGGGYGGVGNVTINGGYVDAGNASANAAGIGGGFCFGTSKVTITGGTVIAQGDDDAAGIGGGYKGLGDITISGGLVKATGGKGESSAIGCGYSRYNSTVNFTNSAIIYFFPPETVSGSYCLATDGYDTHNEWTCILLGCRDANYKAEYANQGQVYGAVTLSQDLEITADGVSQRLDVPDGASLTIPAGKTLTNNGTLHIAYGGELDGAGTLEGSGTFETENLTADSIVAPAGIAANGEDRSADILADLTAPTATLCGKAFTVVGWTKSSVAPAVEGSVTDYVITYTNDADDTKTVSQTVTLPKSGTQFVGDGAVTAYKDNVAATDFTYGETVTVKAKPTQTGQPAQQSAALFSLSAPTAGQMALYLNETQVSEAADAAEDGTYTMTASVKDLVAAGAQYGEATTLTARFVSTDIMADGQGTVDVTLGKKALTPSVNGALTKVYDGTTAFTVPAGNIALDGIADGDAVSATAAATLGSMNAGSQSFTGAALTLSGADAGNYALSAEALDGTVTVTQKSLTVTAKDQTIPYGEDVQSGADQVTCEGLVDGDALSDVTVSKTATAVGTHTGAITASNAAITRGGADVTANYAISYVPGDLTVEKATPTVSAWPTAGAITYGQTLNNSGLTGGTAGVAGSFAWTDPSVQPAVADSGVTQYAVTFTPDDPNYNTVSGAITLTVNKATPAVTAPTANTLTYNASAQDLVTAGSATGGTVQYSPDGTNYSAAIPQETDAGSYTVYYRVVGGENYEDVAAQSVTVTIGPRTLTAADVTVTVTPSRYEYTGSAIVPAAENVAVTYQDGGKTLTVPGSEYTFSCTDNIAHGTATLTVADKEGGNYTVSGTGSFAITQPLLDLAEVTLGESEYTYDGTAKTPAVTVVKNGQTLTQGTDYTVSYENNVNAGDATVTVTAAPDGNYDGSKSVIFPIHPKDIAGAEITLGSDDPTYTGAEQIMPVASVTVDGLAATYTVSGDTGTDAGAYTLTVTGSGNFTGTATKGWKILPASLNGAAFAPIEAQNFTDQALTPEPAVTVDSKTLAAGTDFTCAYENNRYVGTATVKITGAGNYTGEASTTFAISPVPDPAVIVTTAAVAQGGKTVDLSGNVTGALGAVSYELTGGEGAVNALGVYTSPARTGAATVTVTVAPKDLNGDGVNEYTGTSVDIAVTVTQRPIDAAVANQTLTASFYAPEAGVVCCAEYDGNGKLLAIQLQSVDPGEQAATFPLKAGAAAYQKVFLLGQALAPQCPAKTVTP